MLKNKGTFSTIQGTVAEEPTNYLPSSPPAHEQWDVLRSEWGVREQPDRATPTHFLSIKILESLGEVFMNFKRNKSL